MKKTLKWFTLIEMLIVIVIIGILAAVLIPKIGWARTKAENVAVKANVRNLAQWVLSAQIAWQNPSNGLSMTWLLSWAMADKYDFTLITSDTGNYTATWNTSNFIICWKLSDAEAGWNSASGADTITNITNWTEWTAWQYYCYKG